MKKKKIIINSGGKRLNILAEDCSFLKKFSGLMFSRREKAKMLLFSFKRRQKIKIHSLFVFYPFIALWFDDARIVDLKIVKPFTICVSSKKPVFNLVEIPINNIHRRIVNLLVGNSKHLNMTTAK